jgi:hypothetical protein
MARGPVRNAKALPLTMLACIACASAVASPITYDFTSRPAAGRSTASSPRGLHLRQQQHHAGRGERRDGTLHALHFTWNGISYTAATANTGSLFFDTGGALVSALFGTQCVAGSCSGAGGTEGWTVSAPGLFLYTPASTDIGFGGTSTLSLATSPSLPGCCSS